MFILLYCIIYCVGGAARVFSKVTDKSVRAVDKGAIALMHTPFCVMLGNTHNLIGTVYLSYIMLIFLARKEFILFKAGDVYMKLHVTMLLP